tara:strand:- start:3184 stop:3534 length:351 start_codon:yes stop_codon:yes gene_type:complete
MFGLKIITFFVAFCFVGYGISCLYSSKMVEEFKRFGLSESQRKLTGVLQILGGVGLIVGFFTHPFISMLAAVGLSLLMLLGFITRIKIKDSFYESSPSFVFMVLNGYLAYGYYLTL